MDDDGYVYIVDRKKDRIVSGDENVCSIDVENVNSGHPSVLVTAVIGVPDDHWREAVTAVVVPRPGHELTEQGLIEHCQKRIARYKVPKKIVFASELPKSGAGKILKREIRQKFWKGQQRLVH